MTCDDGKNRRAAQFARGRPRLILAAGAASQIFAGIPAAWSVFGRAVQEEYRITQGQSLLIFSLLVASCGPGYLIGGFWQDRAGPRAPALCGAVLMSAAFAGAAFFPAEMPALFYGCFSVPAGTGSAFLYPAVMSCVQKWYCTRKGLATGVTGAAFGLSGAVLSLCGTVLTRGCGIRTAFAVLGAMMLLICGTGAALLVNPPSPPEDCSAQKKEADISLRQVLLSRQYRILTACAALAQPPVLLFSPFITEFAQQRGLSAGAALLCVAAGSAGSAAGRLLMPWCSDKTGRKAADLFLFAALAALSVWFAFARGAAVPAVYAMLTFCYSGQAAILPAACTDLFGYRRAGVHYGLTALGMSAGSVAFPLLARCFSGTAARHILAAAAAAAGFVLMLFLKFRPAGEGQK